MREMRFYSRLGITVLLSLFWVFSAQAVGCFHTEAEQVDIETVFKHEGADSLFYEDPFPIRFLDNNYFIEVDQEEVWDVGIDYNGHAGIYRTTLVEKTTNAGLSYNFSWQLHGDVLFTEYSGGATYWACGPGGYDVCSHHELQRSYVQYLHLTPGDYRIRIGFVNTNEVGGTHDWTNEQWFNLFSDSPGGWWEEIEINVPDNSGQPPWECSIELVNLEEYMAWLPSAALSPGDPTPGITLQLVVHSDSPDPMWMRMGLSSTQLPARWTNDYLRSYEAIPGKKRRYYQTAINLDKADLVLDKHEPDNADWKFGFALDSLVLAEETRYFSRQLAVTLDPVYSGDTLSLRISSHDFGADGWLIGGLNKTDNDPGLVRNFDGNDLFVREIAGFYVSGLPIPRDEEIIFSQYIFKGDTLNGITIGDGIGDAWEERYVDPNANVPVNEDIDSLQDSLIYGSIYTLVPENDDSDAYKGMFPPYNHAWALLDNYSAYEDTLKPAGDGFRNLEKYRGLNGIESAAEYTHIRLAPHARTVVVIQYPRDLGQYIGYDKPSLSSFMNTSTFRAVKMKTHEDYNWNEPNDQSRVINYRIVDGMFDMGPIHGWVYIDENDHIFDNSIVMGARELNDIYTVIKNYQKVVAAYQSYQYLVTRDQRKQYYEWLELKEDFISNSVKFVTYLGLVNQRIDVYGWLPISRYLCNIFGQHIDMYSELYASTRDSTGQRQVDNDLWIETRESLLEKVSAHELGHFIGMWHPDPSNDHTIMKENNFYNRVEPPDTFHFGGFEWKDVDSLSIYDSFINIDYRYFQLSQPAAIKGD